MKKIAILLSGILLSGFLLAQEARFSGKISNPTTDMVRLTTNIEVEGKNKEVVLDSSKVSAEGTFSMTADIEKTTLCIFYDGGEMTRILLSPGDDIAMTMNTLLFDETLVYGGKGADKNNALKNIFLYEEAVGNNFMSFPADADTSDMFAYLDRAYDTYTQVIEDYRKDISDFSEYGQELIEGVEHTKKRIKGRLIQEREYNALVEALKGKEGVDFEGVDLKGNKVKISDFKGKTIVIDFWATWCGPCKAEMPSLKELEGKYGKDVNFLSVAVWCDQEEWKTMATDYGFEHNIYIGKGMDKQFKDYNVRFIPRYIVLDKDFNILDADAPRPSSGNLQQYF